MLGGAPRVEVSGAASKTTASVLAGADRRDELVDSPHSPLCYLLFPDFLLLGVRFSGTRKICLEHSPYERALTLCDCSSSLMLVPKTVSR